MGTRAQSLRLMAVSVIVAVALVGCTADTPDAPAPPATTTPVPVDVPDDDAPAPRISADCADLVSIETVRSVIAADSTERPIDHRSPEDAAPQQAGTLECLWANTEPRQQWEDPDPAEASVRLTVVPDGANMWARVSEVYSHVFGPSPYGADALGPSCNGPFAPATTGGCQFEALVGSYWVSLSLGGVVAGDGSADGLVVSARRLIDPLLERMAEEGEPGAPWTPPGGGPEVPLDCGAVLTAEQAESITGVANLYVDLHMDGPMTSPLVHALEVTGSDRCAIGIRASDEEIGDVSYLPGGAWAFQQSSASWLASGATEISLDGAEAGEQFISQCVVDSEECLVDMLVGDDWLQVRLPPWLPDVFAYPLGVDMQYQRGQVTEIAEAVLANLHARA